MKILLSIKPQFANKIFNGTKKYEFRKSIFNNYKISKVIVYASSPIKKVVGEFEIEDIITDEPEILWEKTKDYSGITKEFFDSYFNERKIAYAIKIKSFREYDIPKCLKSDFDILFPPQSFRYIDKTKENVLATTCYKSKRAESAKMKRKKINKTKAI